MLFYAKNAIMEANIFIIIPMIIQKFKQLLDDMVQTQIPDIHFTAGSTPHIRKHSGDIEVLASFGITEQDDILAIVVEMIGQERADKLIKSHE